MRHLTCSHVIVAIKCGLALTFLDKKPEERPSLPLKTSAKLGNRESRDMFLCQKQLFLLSSICLPFFL